MTRAIFQDLLKQLWPHLEWQHTGMWLPLPMDNTWLALALMKLPTPARLCYIGHLFGVGMVTARKAILEVCSTLQDVLGGTMLHVHDPMVAAVEFHALGFPQCMGP
ncbi:hypothetical protein Y1Q_0015173 [Alligator mississippiensis]|uniref:Transposase Helix-turn-helix domain-containing protein n=1 Tax=Alligator mississippiensis TaxID=8496 RepID=A0A151P913_ALLMI|nr:hypothetical protein Y1Q_0015173 [Alligator mississippiensis]